MSHFRVRFYRKTFLVELDLTAYAFLFRATIDKLFCRCIYQETIGQVSVWNNVNNKALSNKHILITCYVLLFYVGFFHDVLYFTVLAYSS